MKHLPIADLDDNSADNATETLSKSPYSSPSNTPPTSPSEIRKSKSRLSPRILRRKHSPRRVRSERSLLSMARRRSQKLGLSRKSYASASDLDDNIYYDDDGAIIIKEPIGSGSYSVVYKGIRLDAEDDVFAVKIITKSQDNDSDRRNFEAEEITFQRLNGEPNIVGYFGTVRNGMVESEPVGFVMKYYQHGDLHEHMKNGRELSKGIEWIMDIIRSISVLHGKDPIILHRDVKSGNFLIDDDFNLRLTDFGLARPDTNDNRGGTLGEIRTSMAYTSPELFRCDDLMYRTSSDIYSMTIVIWEVLNYVLTGFYRMPHIVTSQWQIPQKVVRGERPPIDKEVFSSDWIALLEKGWHSDPDQRPDVEGMMDLAKDLSS